MIYQTKERAEEVAKMLNAVPGNVPSEAIHTKHGWTVVSGYTQAQRHGSWEVPE